jgi:hypothetical protein
MNASPLLAAALACSACATTVTTSRDITQIPTAELCSLRLVDNNFDRVIAELERRRAFTEDDLVQIRRHAIVPGMSDAAVRCSYGRPQQVVTNSPGDDFDTVYIYGLEGIDSRRLGETRVYLADGRVVRREELPMLVN